MTAKSVFDRIPRIIAFLWGFAFIHLFKYNLEKIYPFWNESAGLSFFAYAIIFVSWAAYAFSFLYKKENYRSCTIVLHVIFLLNSAIFLFFVLKFGEESYLYTYPLFFNLQMIIYIFLFTSTMRFVLGYRISLLAGAIAGLLTYPYLGSIYIDILLPALLYLLTNFFIPEKKSITSGSHLRMAVLRESLDFLRYFLLALALFGSFDTFRSHFYLSIFILSIGPLLSYFLLKADKRKHHVKYGITVLALFFFGFAVLTNFIHINFASAIGFSFLTIWEGIYFKKTSEGYLKREIILSGTALFISIIFYFFSVEWVMIISSFIIVIIQIRILRYLAKSYRKGIAAAFLVSLAGWSFSLYYNYNKSYKREFLIPLKTSAVPSSPPLKILGFFRDSSKTYYTNLFPREVIESISSQNSPVIIFEDIPSPFLIWNISRISSRGKNHVQIYSTDELKTYRHSPGKELLNQYISSRSISNVFFFNKKEKVFLTPTELESDINIFNSILTSNEILMFGEKLAAWYVDHKDYESAVSIYLELLDSFDETRLLRSIAHVYGITGNTEGQIEYRQKVYSRHDSTIEDKIILMELYFLFGRNQQANEICETLLYNDPGNISLYEWKYKIISQKKNRYQLETLKNTLLYRIIPSKDQIFHRDNLVNKINEDLKSIPEWNEIFNTEKRRQENIVYPE